jgi:hypothetical protein
VGLTEGRALAAPPVFVCAQRENGEAYAGTRSQPRSPTPPVGPQPSARRNDEWQRLRVPDPAASAERGETGRVPLAPPDYRTCSLETARAPSFR